ncbi:MAG: hypothetical protein AB7V48_10475 [Sedimentibacter sp.]
MDSKYSCFEFIANNNSQNLTVYCRDRGFSKDEAKNEVCKVLNSKYGNNCDLKFVGKISFSDIDQELINDQNKLFEKHDAVWILNGSNSMK